MMSVMVMSHREVDGFVDSFAPSQQTLGMKKGHGSTKHLISEATRELVRVSHHLSQNRTTRGEGGSGRLMMLGMQERCKKDLQRVTPASCASKCVSN